DEDAATYFLFDSREGYCDLFATAFALMCRAADVPSRVAVGYTEGEYNPSTKEYLVRESDGHAWVEVFLEGRGWMTIDPTPPAEITEAAQQARAGPSWLKKILGKMHFSWGVLFFCLLVCAGAVKVLWFDPWSEQRKWEKRLWTDMRGRITVLYARMCRLLARRGLLRQPWQTPLEYLEALSSDKEKMGAATGPAEELTRIFISARYAAEAAGPQNVAAAQRALQRLKQSLRRNGRLRFLWKKEK
nr:DUF4129 domain-containing protein [Armatimonadota bacterium]NIO76958.1 DUF4129 domain-containing protein [Armatimonadota bacterium]NIO97252.1 DUF4129 domain-containing protein [Armatimonadota bacterium]